VTADDGTQGRLSDLVDRRLHVLDRHHRTDRILHPVIRHRRHVDDYVVLGDDPLRLDRHRDDPQRHPMHTIDERDDEDQTRWSARRRSGRRSSSPEAAAAFSAGRGRWSVPAPPNGARQQWQLARKPTARNLVALGTLRRPDAFAIRRRRRPVAGSRSEPTTMTCSTHRLLRWRHRASISRASWISTGPTSSKRWRDRIAWIEQGRADRSPARNQRRAGVRRDWRGRLLSVSDRASAFNGERTPGP
jgi:hypothetical protein